MSQDTSEALRLLVTGASGQVGGELVHTLAPLGTVIAPSRSEMDLGSPDSVRAFIRDFKPQWIVNAGAYTAVDKAESEPELAHAINADTPGVIGEEAKRLGASVIHYSTDYVFNGQGTLPYVETDPTGPLGVYGASKLAGEQALVASGAHAMIFRTSWVFGATGKNFLRTMLKLAPERESLSVVADQHGAPTWSRDLARMAAHIVAHSIALRSEERDKLTGIYHAAGTGETTWAGFAEEAIRQLHLRQPELRLAQVAGIPTSAYPTPAKRPSNSRLNCSKLHQTFGWQMVEWRQAVTNVVAESA